MTSLNVELKGSQPRRTSWAPVICLTRGTKPGRVSPAMHRPQVAAGVYWDIVKICIFWVQRAMGALKQHFMQGWLRSISPSRPLCEVVLSKGTVCTDFLQQQRPCQKRLHRYRSRCSVLFKTLLLRRACQVFGVLGSTHMSRNVQMQLYGADEPPHAAQSSEMTV